MLRPANPLGTLRSTQNQLLLLYISIRLAFDVMLPANSVCDPSIAASTCVDYPIILCLGLERHSPAMIHCNQRMQPASVRKEIGAYIGDEIVFWYKSLIMTCVQFSYLLQIPGLEYIGN